MRLIFGNEFAAEVLSRYMDDPERFLSDFDLVSNLVFWDGSATWEHDREEWKERKACGIVFQDGYVPFLGVKPYVAFRLSASQFLALVEQGVLDTTEKEVAEELESLGYAEPGEVASWTSVVFVDQKDARLFRRVLRLINGNAKAVRKLVPPRLQVLPPPDQTGTASTAVA